MTFVIIALVYVICVAIVERWSNEDGMDEAVYSEWDEYMKSRGIYYNEDEAVKHYLAARAIVIASGPIMVVAAIIYTIYIKIKGE